MNRRASCVGTFEVFEAAHVALRTLLAFSQPVNCIFWPIGMLNWLVAASKLHKHRETCCTAEWPFSVISYSMTMCSFEDTVTAPAERCDLVGVKLRKKCANFFKYVAFVGKEWSFIIWLNTAYYTTKVSVINTQSSIYNFAKII